MSGNNTKLDAVKIVSLLYVDALLGFSTSHIKQCNDLLGYIQEPEMAMGVDNDRMTITQLKELTRWMIFKMEDGERLPIIEFKMRVEQAAAYEPWIKDALGEIYKLADADDTVELATTRKSLHLDIADKLARYQLEDVIRSLYKTAIFDGGIVNTKEFSANAVERFSKFMSDDSGQGSESSQGTVMTNNYESAKTVMTKVLRKDIQKRSGNMILKTGYQAINDMLRGGPRMGEMIINIAMRYNFKSGLIVNIFRQIAKYNRPVIPEDGKKPTLVFITFEADLSAVIFSLYAGIVENQTRQPLTQYDLNLSVEEKTEIVIAYFSDLGWNAVIHHQNPTSWTYEDLFKFTDDLVKKGCKIVALFADYLYQVPKTGCQLSGIIGEDTKLFYSRIRAHYKMADTLVWTPHQMSGKARDVMDYNSGLLVENVVGAGLLEGCRSIDNVVDVEIYQHAEIDKRTGKKALAIARGKHKLEGEVEDPVVLLALMWYNEYTTGKMYYCGILDDVGYGGMYSRKLSSPPVALHRDSIKFDEVENDF